MAGELLGIDEVLAPIEAGRGDRARTDGGMRYSGVAPLDHDACVFRDVHCDVRS